MEARCEVLKSLHRRNGMLTVTRKFGYWSISASKLVFTNTQGQATWIVGSECSCIATRIPDLRQIDARSGLHHSIRWQVAPFGCTGHFNRSSCTVLLKRIWISRIDDARSNRYQWSRNIRRRQHCCASGNLVGSTQIT